MASYEIRTIGDPVLKQVATDVSIIDATTARLVDDMLDTMYEAPGIGLAAPQIGVQKRLIVWDIGEGPESIINPRISESDGEWVFEEGCLSIPGLYFEIVRPKLVHVEGLDLDGNEVSFDADELLARLFQHELDHLDGVLMVERLDDDQKKEARKMLRQRMLGASDAPVPVSHASRDGDGGIRGLRLPMGSGGAAPSDGSPTA